MQRTDQAEYQSLWDEFNHLCNRGPRKHATRLVAVAERLAEILTDPYAVKLWTARAQFIRAGQYGRIWRAGGYVNVRE